MIPRVDAVVLDLPAGRFDAAVRFWADALSATPRPFGDDPASAYVTLEGASSVLPVWLQRLGSGTARIHLDLVVDEDVDRGADLAVAAGAVREVREDDHWILRDPAGLWFCVIAADWPHPPVAAASDGGGRLSSVFADVPAAVAEPETRFWSRVLGAAVEPTTRPATYTAITGLSGPGGDLSFEVQRVDDGATIGPVPRYHVDLAAGDVAAEAARLEALGAQRVAEVETWVILRDPAGIPFCVVPED